MEENSKKAPKKETIKSKKAPQKVEKKVGFETGVELCGLKGRVMHTAKRMYKNEDPKTINEWKDLLAKDRFISK